MVAAPVKPEAAAGADAILEAIAARVSESQRSVYGFKHTGTGSPLTDNGYTHGPGGNMSFPGVDPSVFHTVVGAKGILGSLPVSATTETNPTYQILTGVQDVTGSEPDGVCDDAPVAGLAKGCLTTSVFGRYQRATQELDVTRLGQVNDRADPMDLSIIGSPIAESHLFTSGPGDPTIPGNMLTNETARKFWELGIALHRLLSTQLWTGDPANNTGAGGYKELTSFPQLIQTGYVDAQTGTACPSVDSDVRDFNFLDVENNGPQIIETLSSMYHFVKDLAERTGVMPVRWVFAMPPELFWELTSVWSCAYLTSRCFLTGIEGARVNVDGAEQVRMRDQMRRDRILTIDGDDIEVVLDDGIPEVSSETSASVTEGCLAAPIYLIPMSVIGGRAVTFLQHFQFNNPAVQDALGNQILGRITGPWLTWPRQTNLCVQWQTIIEPRLVMRTPWLAGRLDNVMYCPDKHTRQPFPSDPYFVDGGLTNRAGPSFFSVWQSN